MFAFPELLILRAEGSLYSDRIRQHRPIGIPSILQLTIKNLLGGVSSFTLNHS